MKPKSLITRIIPLLILLFTFVTPHTSHADIDSFDDVIEALKQMQRDDPDFSKIRDPEGTIKNYIKSSIEKTFVDSILGQKVDPIMAKIFKKTHEAIDSKSRSKSLSKCNRAVMNIAWNVSSNLDRRAMLTGFARIGIDTIKEIFGVAVNPADYIKGKIKSGYKDLLKKLYQDAVKDALKGMTTPIEFESDFSLFGKSYATCSPKVLARWIPASGTYRVYIKGDCGCSAMPEGALVGRNHVLGKWEVQAVGTVEPQVKIEGDSVTIEYLVRRPRIIIYSDDPRPNCGCKIRPAPITVTVNPANLALNPGDPGQINVTATDSATGNAVNIRSATISGLVPVIKGNTEPAAAGLPGGMATFAFTVAKPRKDRTYSVTVQVITVDGATLSGRGTVTVKNVAPKITEEVSGTDANPGALMQLQNISVKVVDDNADNNNPGEVRVSSLTLGGHPDGLNTDKTFDKVDRRSKKSFDSSTGTYIFEFSRNGGKVEKPHKHKEFTTDVTVNDYDGKTANASVTLEVNDVAPTVEKIEVEPQFVHAGDDKKIAITGIFQDDNGWEDIKNETSFVDATAAGGEKFVLNDKLEIIKKEKDYIKFKAEPFSHIKTVGKHSIPVHVEDKGPQDGDDHPDGPHSGDDNTFLNVGDEKPVINPWGYIYSLELGGIPDPEQKGDGLCPGQPFTAGAIVKDPENDPLIVTATIVETGVQVQLTRAEGEKTYKGVLFAPQTPGEYTLRFDAKEKPPLTQVADAKTSKLTVIPCGEDQVGDLGFGSEVNPQEVCTGGSFTATGFEILYMKDKTQKKVNLPGTITFQGNTQAISPANPSVTFTAPDTPGIYPVNIVLNLGGQKIKLTNQVTVIACGACVGEGCQNAGVAGDLDLVSIPLDFVIIAPCNRPFNEAMGYNPNGTPYYGANDANHDFRCYGGANYKFPNGANIVAFGPDHGAGAQYFNNMRNQKGKINCKKLTITISIFVDGILVRKIKQNKDKPQITPNDTYYKFEASAGKKAVRGLMKGLGALQGFGGGGISLGGGGSKKGSADDQWGLWKVGFTPLDSPSSAWKIETGEGKPVVVAVIDSGLDITHPDLSLDNLWRNEKEIPGNFIDDDGNGHIDDTYGWNFIDWNNAPFDNNGHGTFVAGIIAAKSNNGIGIAGINQGVKIMPLKVTNYIGETNNFDIYRAIVYAVDNSASVINISLGERGFSKLEQIAIDYAYDNGVIVVVAAGNEGLELVDYGPAGSQKLLAVAALDVSGRKRGSSNYGPTVAITAPGEEIISLRARETDFLKRIGGGSGILGSDGLYYKATGSSFAAPFVSGVASLMKARNPDITNAELEGILMGSALDIGEPGWDIRSGAGLLNARGALTATKDKILTARITKIEKVDEGKKKVSYRIYGVASGGLFKDYSLSVGKGKKPKKWSSVGSPSIEAKDYDLLGTVDSKSMKGFGKWNVRLTVNGADGSVKEVYLPFPKR